MQTCKVKDPAEEEHQLGRNHFSSHSIAMYMNSQTRNVATASAPSVILLCCFLFHDFCYWRFLEGSGIFPVLASPRGPFPRGETTIKMTKGGKTFPVKFLPPVSNRNSHIGNLLIVEPYADAVTSQAWQWQEYVKIPGGRRNQYHWPKSNSALMGH